MADNLVQKEGRYQQWVVASKSAGDPVINGGMTGVCLTDSDAANKVSVDMGGVYEVSVKGINDAGNSAVSIGDKIFYVIGDTPLLSKKGSGYFFGFALSTVGSGLTATIPVLQIMGPGPGTADILAGIIGTAELADEAVTVDKMADLARGSILSGQTAGNRPAALDAKASGQILVGDGTDLVSVPVSGDATLAANGALTIAAGAVESSMLANGAGVAAALAAGLGASDAYAKTTDGAQELLADDVAARVVLGMVVVDEVFADGTGSQTVFTIGETDTANKFMANTVLVDAAAGAVFFFAGTLTAAKDLIVTGTAATGNGTGGISVTVLVLQAAA